MCFGQNALAQHGNEYTTHSQPLPQSHFNDFYIFSDTPNPVLVVGHLTDSDTIGPPPIQTSSHLYLYAPQNWARKDVTFPGWGQNVVYGSQWDQTNKLIDFRLDSSTHVNYWNESPERSTGWSAGTVVDTTESRVYSAHSKVWLNEFMYGEWSGWYQSQDPYMPWFKDHVFSQPLSSYEHTLQQVGAGQGQ